MQRITWYAAGLM